MSEKSYNYAFATLSLGGFNGTKRGAQCSSSDELLKEWWWNQGKKGRTYNLSRLEMHGLKQQAERMMEHRRINEPKNSAYWKIVEEKRKSNL